jgi:DivIVA domain-containing protein
MTLSLDDVRNKRFRMARKSGYEVLEVDEFVAEVRSAAPGSCDSAPAGPDSAAASRTSCRGGTAGQRRPDRGDDKQGCQLCRGPPGRDVDRTG